MKWSVGSKYLKRSEGPLEYSYKYESPVCPTASNVKFYMLNLNLTHMYVSKY
jgi:hypothetical protein